MAANRSLLFVPLIALFGIIVAIGCDGWDGLTARKNATKTQRKPKDTPPPKSAGVDMPIDEPVDPSLKKALEIEADLTRVTSATEALEKIRHEIADDASLAPELTPNLIAYARLADKFDLALEKAKPFAAENADDVERLLRLTQAIVEPAAFLGLEKHSETVARRKDEDSMAWAKSETGKKLAKIAVQSAEQGQKLMLEEGDPELFEHLFDQLHVGLLLAEAHKAAGHRHKAVKAIEGALESTRRQRDEIKSAVEELRGLKRQLAPGNSAASDSTDDETAESDDEK